MEEPAIVRWKEKQVQEPRPQVFQSLPEDMININAQVHEVMGKLDYSRSVGLTGMGGLGKTTIAKAIFNDLVSKFEYSCFLQDVRLIRGGEDDLKNAIWDQMHRHGKKVQGRRNWSSVKVSTLLLVLDNIDSYRDKKVLLDLANEGSVESRFIVTSRNQALLRFLGEVYVVPHWNTESATLLFKNQAFPNREIPPKELEGVMQSIIRMCDGLPLALEVAGEHLQGIGNCEVWEQTLRELEKAEKVITLDERLWTKLRVSYDCLEPKEKEVFLDACTFFCTGSWTLREAKAAWSAAYETNGSLLWQRLVDMSLVYSLEEHEFIKVQQQLKILGQKLAQEPSNDKLRVWEGEVGWNILQTTNDLWEGKAIHSLRLDVLPTKKWESVETEHSHHEDYESAGLHRGFIAKDFRDRGSQPVRVGNHIPRVALSKLKNVRFLEIIAPVVIDGAATEGDSVPTEVLLFKCSRQDLFDPAVQTQLAVLKLYCFYYLPGSIGRLSALKYMEIYDCNAESMPESFGQLSALNSLSFSHCDQLQTLPESFGQLSALNSLSFSYCPKLQTLPESFGQLSGLKSLSFSYFRKLQTLPESFGQLSALNSLSFSYCGKLQTLPESLEQLCALNSLSFSYCRELQTLPESFGQLSALNSLSFFHCDLLQTLPESFGQLSALNSLSFYYCWELQTLPESFGQLSALNSLSFSYCEKLQTLPESFGQLSALNSLSFSHCWKLQTLPESFGQLSALHSLSFSYCRELQTLPDSFGQWSALDRVSFERYYKLQTLPKSSWPLSASDSVELGSFPEDLEHLTATGASKPVSASRSVGLKEFIKNVEEGGEDGYFVSNIWLHRLVEHDRNSLMSTLWGASYSEIHQTATTTLFARLENDVQFPVPSNDATRTSTKNYVHPSDIDDHLGISAKGLTLREDKADTGGVFRPVQIGETKEPPSKKIMTEEFPPYTDLQKTSRDLLKEHSRLDVRKVTFEDIAPQLEKKCEVDMSVKMDHVKALILEEASRLTEGALGAQTPIFKEALEAMEVAAAEKNYDSGIAIDNGWKRLEEQESRDVPYVEVASDESPPKWMVAQTSTSASTFESMEQYHPHPLVFKTPTTDDSTYPSTRSSTTGGRCDNEPSTSSQNMEFVGSDIHTLGTPRSGSSLGERKNVDQADVTGGSFRPALKQATSQFQVENICTCHPQLLTVECSSGSGDAIDIEQPPGMRIKKQKFGDELVFTTAATKVGSEKISATVDRSFSMTTVDFASGQERSNNLKATTKIALSCCLKPNKDHHQVRIKLLEIYGEVKSEASNDQLCNGMVLSTVCTNFSAARIDDEDAWEEITLKLEDEGYQVPQYRRVLERVDPTATSDDLVWLSISNILPDGCDPLSITLELRGDVIKRRKIDFLDRSKRAHVLHFQNIPSDIVIFEGDVDTVRHGTSKLELKIRHRLEISYYTPGISIVPERAVWSAIGTAIPIEFDCCLDIRTEQFKFGKI